MAIIRQIKTPSSNKYDIYASGIPYAQVDSTSTSTDFTATVPGITSLEDGTCVLLKNGQVTSASGFTININGLGDKPVYSNLATGNDITPTDPTRDTTIFNINYTMLFIYNSTIVDGGGWICYRGYDANTTYTLTVSTAANSTVHLVSGSSTVANVTIPNTTNTTYNTFSTGSNGLVPKPSSNSTNVYLNANGSWTIPVDNDTTYSVFNSTKDGLVPKPTTGQSASGYYLSGQGTWESFAADLDFYGTTATNKYTVTLDNINTGDSMDADIPLATSAVAGVVKPNGTSTHYLNGTGGWTAPPNATYTLTGTTSTSDYKVALSGANAATATIPLATSARAGLVKPDGTSTHCLNGTGGWSAFNNYTHPSYTAATGAPTSNQTPTFGGTFSVNQVNRDSTGHISALTNRTITIPNSTFTTSANGLVPKPTSAATNTFLNSCGTWTTPESGIVMTAMTTAEVQSAVQNGWGSIVNGNNIGF